jgi:hypothetical protein
MLDSQSPAPALPFLHRMWSIAMPQDPPYRMAALQFHRVLEDLEIWSADSDGYSFTISFFESFPGPGFKCRPGFVASWRPLYGGRGAIKIIGSPFKSFDGAEAACDEMLKHLLSDSRQG